MKPTIANILIDDFNPERHTLPIAAEKITAGMMLEGVIGEAVFSVKPADAIRMSRVIGIALHHAEINAPIKVLATNISGNRIWVIADISDPAIGQGEQTRPFVISDDALRAINRKQRRDLFSVRDDVN